MLATVLAPWLARRGIHYGWAIAAVTFLTMLATSACVGLPGVLIVPLRGEFGWDTGAISGPLALRIALYGLVGPFAAALMLRYGVRAVVCTALALIIAGLGLATFMTEIWQLWLTWGLIVGFATGMTAMVLGATIANRWFTATARPGARAARRQYRDGAIAVSARRRLACPTCRLANGGHSRRRRLRCLPRAGAADRARPPR